MRSFASLKGAVLGLVLVATSVAQAATDSPLGPDYSLSEFLDLTVSHSPSIAASRSRKDQAEDGVIVARSGYMPIVNFEAIDSAGFPGSTSLVGVGGIMGSPFRSGAAYGAVLTQTLWDFGRTYYQLASAKNEVSAQEMATQISKYKVEVEAANAFYECGLYRSQMEAWERLGRESERVAAEVVKYVQSGQRAIVEKYLVDAQTEEALTAQATFSEKYRASLRLLTALTGVRNRTCPPLPIDVKVSSGESGAAAWNPFLLSAEAELNVAKFGLEFAKSQRWPTLIGVASVGGMDQARLVDEHNYAVGAGLSIPLFDGLRTTGEIRRAEARVAEREHEVDAARQNFEELEARLDGSVQSSRTRFTHLLRELELAEKSFEIAKKRYFSLQGPLIDIRESLRNVSRASAELNDTAAEFWIATSSKKLLILPKP